MIARIWYGYTTPDNADAYEALLKTEIFPGILARNVAGFRRIELLRGLAGEEAEFATVMWFDSLESVRLSPAPTMRPRWCSPKRAPCSSPGRATTECVKKEARVRQGQAVHGDFACPSFRCG